MLLAILAWQIESLIDRIMRRSSEIMTICILRCNRWPHTHTRIHSRKHTHTHCLWIMEPSAPSLTLLWFLWGKQTTRHTPRRTRGQNKRQKERKTERKKEIKLIHIAREKIWVIIYMIRSRNYHDLNMLPDLYTISFIHLFIKFTEGSLGCFITTHFLNNIQ